MWPKCREPAGWPQKGAVMPSDFPQGCEERTTEKQRGHEERAGDPQEQGRVSRFFGSHWLPILSPAEGCHVSTPGPPATTHFPAPLIHTLLDPGTLRESLSLVINRPSLKLTQ